MLPGITGFRFDTGHVIFLGVFYTALILIAVTVLRSVLRTRRALASGKEPAIRWRDEFHDLPRRSQSCRHEITGEVADRACPNAFDCRVCKDHHKYAPAGPASASEINVLGVTIPLDRHYHRGHTWVHGERDGTFTIGLDGLASRIIGPALKPELPPVGTRLELNAPGWTMKLEDESVRVLAPLDGLVVETADGSAGWLLRIQMHSDALITHLLSGAEVEAWMNKEVERLEAALSSAGIGVALADGGALVENPGQPYPKSAWSAARSEFFLE